MVEKLNKYIDFIIKKVSIIVGIAILTLTLLFLQLIMKEKINTNMIFKIFFITMYANGMGIAKSGDF